MPESDGDRLATTVLLAAAHAALFALSFPLAGLWPLTFVSVAPLAWLALGAASTRRAVIAVIAVQFPMWLWLEAWLLEVTVVGWPPLALYMSLYPAVFVWLVRRIDRHPRVGAWPATLVVPVVWVGLECFRGKIIFYGYPWYLVGQPLIEWPVLAQAADVLGVYGVSFLAVMISGLIVDVLAARGGHRSWRALALAAAVTGGVHLANLGYGLWRLGGNGAVTPGPTLLAIQTNLPQSNKVAWGPQQQREDVARFVDQTLVAFDDATAAGAAPDLVIWPETMLPGFGLEPATVRTLVDGDYYPGDLYSGAVAALAGRLGVPLLAGSPCFLGLRVVDDQWAWDAQYNSAYLVTGEPPYQRYDKVHLTPFGETMPYVRAWPWLEDKLLRFGAGGMSFDLDESETPVLIDLVWRPPAGGPPRTLTLATPICFEDTMGRVIRRMVYEGGYKRADILVNLSNDGWFGFSGGGRARHAQAARFRCIENRVPMIRAVNTGMTVACDPAGRLVARTGEGRYPTAGRPDRLWAELPLDSRSTVYGRIGDTWGWTCLAGAAGLAVLTFAGVRREHASS